MKLTKNDLVGFVRVCRRLWEEQCDPFLDIEDVVDFNRVRTYETSDAVVDFRFADLGKVQELGDRLNGMAKVTR